MKASTLFPELSTWPFLGTEREQDQVCIDDSLIFLCCGPQDYAMRFQLTNQ